MSRQWTDEQIETASSMWRSGVTARMTAEALGAGFTRSSILGKMHRLGVATPNAHNHTRYVKPVVVAPVKKEETPRAALGRLFDRVRPEDFSSCEDEPNVAAPVDPPPDDDSISIFETRDGVCRWPLEDRWGGYIDEKRFCGAACDIKRPYCATHHARAHTKNFYAA